MVFFGIAPPEHTVTERFVTALIGVPFGLKGFVKVKPFSGETAHLLALRTAVLRRGEKEWTLRIEASLPQPPGILIKFAGFDSPEAAKVLAGAELLVDREQASPLRPGEYYVEDLRGLAITDENDEILGRVTDIVEGGGGELVEIRLLNGTLKLVPFRTEFFAEISPEQGRLTLLNRWILE
jgi:16S rRNA processing protein RimM